MAEHQPQDDQEARWRDWTWVALLALAGLATGFVLWLA